MITDSLPIHRALISVSDKRGIQDFAKALTALGIEVISTGGTAKDLRVQGIPVRDVSEVTDFPEIMGGRVKTLHPRIHGGILARRENVEDMATMVQQGIPSIDLVVINLYPFEETVASGADFATCVENIDIGGPSMIRAAAKNHAHVAVMTDPADYDRILEEIKTHKGVSATTRKNLAAKAFALTCAYDAAIAAWMTPALDIPERVAITGIKASSLRYGENPHQKAALYHAPCDMRPGPARARVLAGKQLSYNNLLDADAAFALVAEFAEPALAIIKHANPCGVALATDGDMVDAYRRAILCDSVSAFGGIVALNRPLDAKTAKIIAQRFVEVVIAPEVEEGALAAFKSGVRVLATGGMPDAGARLPIFRHIMGGLLVEEWDHGRVNLKDLKVVTKRAPSAQELADMLFAWRVAKHVKSNAIVYVKDGATVGIGAGQMSRVDSARIAALKAVDAAKEVGLTEPLTMGSVVASDAFFPFADGLIAAAQAGASAVIQPGGSVRDAEVIEAANARDLAMVFTGMRHFRT